MNIVFAKSAWYGCAVIDAHADAMRAVGAGPGVDDVERVGGCRGARVTFSRRPSK